MSAARAAPTLRSLLILLVLGVLLPTLGFAAFAVLRFAEAERSRVEARAEEIAREATSSLDRYFGEVLAAARVVAGSESLAAGDLAAFHRRAVEAQAAFGASNIGLRDANSRQILNTAIPWGGALPTGTRVAREDARAAETGQPVFTGIFVGLADGWKQFSVILPLPDTGVLGAPRFMNFSAPVTRVQDIMQRELTLVPGMVAVVIDRDGNFVAHSADPEAVGRPSPNVAAATGQRVGTLWGPGPGGEPVFVAYRWSEVANWRTSIAVPQAVLDAPLHRALRNLALVGAAALAAALFVAVLLGRRLSQAVWSLTRTGGALESGTAVAPPRTGLRETDEVGQALAEAAHDLAAREAARAAAAGALRDSDERFRVALLAAPLTAYTCDRELRYTWIANPHRDVSDGGLLGRRDDEVEGSGTAEEKAALMGLKREVIETGEGTRRDLRWTGADGVVNFYDVTAEPLRDEATGAVTGATVAALDVTGRIRTMQSLQEQEARQRLLINELNHRVKNTLASVQSIAAQTLRAASGTEAARAQLQDRLMALAAAHDVLTRQSWEGASLVEVLSTALAPHRPAEPERLRLDGPPVWLTPRVALALSLAAHELATNAVKYGALKAGSTGSVAVTWTLDPDRRLRLRWEESGGPPVAGPPARRGFGTRLIERGLAQDLGGQVRIEFAPGGVVCTVEAVLAALEEAVAVTAAHHSP